MASTPSRRPMPALISLLVLSLLTTLVWWRVIHRADSQSASPAPTCTPAPKVTAAPTGAGTPAGPSLAVLNSTSRTGLAAKASADLQKAGFVVTRIDNTTPPFAQVAQIKYAKADVATAQKVAALIPGSTLTANGTAGVIEIDLGSQFTAISNGSAAPSGSPAPCQ